MGKVLFALLLTTAISLGAQTPLNVIDSRCVDRSDANHMQVNERGDSIYLSLSGSSIFNLPTDYSWGSHMRIKIFQIKKSDCKFSDNKRHIFCDSVSEVDVTVHTLYAGSNKPSVVKVKELSLEVLHFSSANHHLTDSTFGLSTRYKVGDTGKYITNNTLFDSCTSL